MKIYVCRMCGIIQIDDNFCVPCADDDDCEFNIDSVLFNDFYSVEGKQIIIDNFDSQFFDLVNTYFAPDYGSDDFYPESLDVLTTYYDIKNGDIPLGWEYHFNDLASNLLPSHVMDLIRYRYP